MSSIPVMNSFWTPIPIEDDTDSAFGDGSNNSDVSIDFNVVKNVEENGRSYHPFSSIEYFLPNDEEEQDRLDLFHHIVGLLLHKKLHLAPIGPDPHRVLDLGTGTGIWAIQISEQYQSASVLGNDLSAIQPEFVPPNLSFEVNNIEESWNYSMPFDYIHCRCLLGGIKDWPKLIRRAFEHTKPGGWVEFMDFSMTFYTGKGEFHPGCEVDKWTTELKEALRSSGFEPEPGPKLKGWIRQAGFTSIQHELFCLPVGRWPKDPALKEIGAYNWMHFTKHLEAFSLRLMTARGWEQNEIAVFLAGVRNDFNNPKFQMQHDAHVVYAQKPIKPIVL